MAPRPAGGGETRPRRIPEATVVRLPLYQRILAEMLRAGATTVSSEELAVRARVNAAKVRKDFSLFGSFGTRGTGYDTAFLAAQIDRALGADRDWPIAIVGIGNLGRALANSDGFSSHGFRVSGLYDVHADVVGARVGGHTVRHLDELFGGPRAAIGVVSTPAAAAQPVADALVAAGVVSILNFAPRVLSVPVGILVRYVDLSIELQVMSFFLARRDPDLPPVGVEPGVRPGGPGNGARRP
ncbi:MAG TPA: redox-sensing transcriptional repressor Rex [Acidimicrobiales bacterium]|nr:redox-sensing transcriptional repressor Rex [Acidimicrobiales bacterium]